MPRFSPPHADAAYREIAERLIAMRLAAQLEPTELCAELNIAANTYSQWESGKTRPTIDDAIRVVARLSGTLDWLFRGIPDGLPFSKAHDVLRLHAVVLSARGPLGAKRVRRAVTLQH